MSDINELVNLITEQKKEIKSLKEKQEKSETLEKKLHDQRNDLEGRIRQLKLEYGAEYGGKGMFKTLNEALAVQTELNKQPMAENQKLHVREDKAFGGAQIDVAARRRYLQSIIELLDSIKTSVEVALKDEKGIT